MLFIFLNLSFPRCYWFPVLFLENSKLLTKYWSNQLEFRLIEYHIFRQCEAEIEEITIRCLHSSRTHLKINEPSFHIAQIVTIVNSVTLFHFYRFQFTLLISKIFFFFSNDNKKLYTFLSDSVYIQQFSALFVVIFIHFKYVYLLSKMDMYTYIMCPHNWNKCDFHIAQKRPFMRIKATETCVSILIGKCPLSIHLGFVFESHFDALTKNSRVFCVIIRRSGTASLWNAE